MDTTYSHQNTLLVVDDKPDNIKLLLAFLKTTGFNVLVAENGQKGIEIATLAHPDMILLDVMMQGMDGFEVCQHLKSQADTQDIPIIFMTALTHLDDKVKGFKLGAADYITKPLQLEEVLARVNVHLSLRQLQQQLSVQNQLLQKEVAERQQSEQALKTAHERFITILDGLEAAVYVTDMQTYEILFVNKHIDQLVNNNELLGKVCWQVFHSTQPCTFCSPNQIMTGKGQPTSAYHWEYQNPDTQRWFYIQGSAIRWIDGRWVRLEVATDITERKQAEEALRANEERFQLAMRGANEGLWDWNLEKNEVYYSPRWKQILGYGEQELSSHPTEFFERLHPDDIPQSLEKVTAYFERKIPHYEITVRMQHKQGHYVWILSRGIAVWNPQGKALRMVGTHMDLTAQKQTEDALSQAKEAAEVANRAKTVFLANMSHELRTPLNAILGYAQLFKRDKTLNAKQQESIAVIQRSGEYLLTLISDVLDVSKIEANRMVLFPVEFDFKHFINEINELFLMRSKQKGIDFHYQFITQLPTVIQADETRLRQIIINLLSNAVKFTKQGEVIFKVGSTQASSSHFPNWKIRFQVEDTGIGIASEELSKIFKPFQQVGERNYQMQGTGLGLAISQKLVEMMGGQLHVESTLGEGSTFWMELDLREVSSKGQLESIDKPVMIGISGPSPKILVVDDQWENRSILTHLLTPLGFEVFKACDGEEGVELATQIQPNAILMDLVMPEMDGFEATRQIRKIPQLKDVVIIAISANVFELDQQDSIKAGCDDFIAKPFQIEILLEKLNQYLNLNTIYQRTAKKSDIQAQADVSISGPSPEQAAILFDLTLIGDIEGILDYLENIEKNKSELKQFVFKVKKLAEDFQVHQIGDLIKPYLQKRPPLSKEVENGEFDN